MADLRMITFDLHLKKTFFHNKIYFEYECDHLFSKDHLTYYIAVSWFIISVCGEPRKTIFEHKYT